MGSNILIVDDERSIRVTFQTLLEEDGYRVETASGVGEALKCLDRVEFDLVFADIVLGREGSGIDLLRAIRERGLSTQVVMVTGAPDVDTASEAVRLGAFDYIPKPLRRDSLLRVARTALSARQLMLEKERYRTNLEAIFRNVKESIVLVDGEMKILEVNDAAGEICGLTHEDIGRPYTEVGRGCSKLCCVPLQQTLESGKPAEIQRARCPSADNPRRAISMTIAPLKLKGGGAVVLVRDESRLHTLEQHLDERQSCHHLTGRSKKMQQLYSLIERLADVNTTVLITGESGTGKELAAEAVHYLGERKGKPLVKVNCAALTENLLESELFGHVKGAFTGAIRDQVGRFQMAEGGTIFLDEIGDISPAMQVRLLRVLQERIIERVGEGTPIPVDVRVVAATNQNLEQKIARGEFREDLFYRLKVVNLKMPPLRERREDIPLLVERLVEKMNQKFHRSVEAVSGEVLDGFMRYNWPGNVRELEHALEHAFVLCRGTFIEMEHLPPELLTALGDATKVQDSDATPNDKEAILAALEKAGGNKAKAARLLNISRRTLYRKLHTFNIDSSDV